MDQDWPMGWNSERRGRSKFPLTSVESHQFIGGTARWWVHCGGVPRRGDQRLFSKHVGYRTFIMDDGGEHKHHYRQAKCYAECADIKRLQSSLRLATEVDLYNVSRDGDTARLHTANHKVIAPTIWAATSATGTPVKYWAYPIAP